MSVSNSYRPRRIVPDRCTRGDPRERPTEEIHTDRNTEKTDHPLRPDGGTNLADWSSLTGFQRDLLVAIAQLEGTDETCSGVAAKRTLESELGYDELSPSQLYPNLDALDVKELVSVSSAPNDRRANSYALTTHGRTLLEARARSVVAILGNYRTRVGDSDRKASGE